MGSLNPCPMAIGLLERICALSAFALHTTPASALVGARLGCAESFRYRRSGWDRPYSRGCRKLHFDQRFACILDRRPTRTDPTDDGQVTVSASQSIEKCVRS